MKCAVPQIRLKCFTVYAFMNLYAKVSIVSVYIISHITQQLYNDDITRFIEIGIGGWMDIHYYFRMIHTHQAKRKLDSLL